MSTGDPRWVEIKADPLLHAHVAGTPVPEDCAECAAKRRAMPEPVIPTPVEPHGIVVCTNDPEPHSLTGDCVDPQPAKWTPGAALALMRRERPDLVPDVTDEDRRKADKIIAKASKRCPRCGETRVMHPVYAVCAPCAAECDGSYRGAPKPTVRESHPAYVEATRIGSCRDLIDGAYARGISKGRRQSAPPDDVRTAAACISQDIRQAIDVLYGELAGEDDAPEDVEATDRAIARDMATVLDWLVVARDPVEHPEATCHRCHGPNIAWSAPSPLWNAVMRGGSINGDEDHDGIVCPVCFATLAEALGIADLWMFSAKRVHVDLETVTPSGRVWDETTWLWREPAEQPEDHSAAGAPLRVGTAPIGPLPPMDDSQYAPGGTPLIVDYAAEQPEDGGQ